MGERLFSRAEPKRRPHAPPHPARRDSLFFMALRITQNQLKRKFKEEITALQDAIHLQCFECMGNQGDGYVPCTDTKCPLFPFRLRKMVSSSSQRLKNKAMMLKKARRG